MGTKVFAEAVGNVVMRQMGDTVRSVTVRPVTKNVGGDHEERGMPDWREVSVCVEYKNNRVMYIAVIQRTPQDDCESHS
jgi:hypothetical protein